MLEQDLRPGSPAGFRSGSVIKNLPAEQETQDTRVQSRGQEDPPEEGMATHSSILGGKIPWTEEPGMCPWGTESDMTKVTERHTQPGSNIHVSCYYPQCPARPAVISHLPPEDLGNSRPSW